MKNPAGQRRRPLYRLMILLPVGLLAAAVAFDGVDLATGTGAFAVAAYWTFAGGVVAGLVAAPFGLVDWLDIPRGTRARHIGALRGGGNLVALLLCAASWLLRDAYGSVPAAALALSLTAALLTAVTAWLGNQVVSTRAAGLDDDTTGDTLSSLDFDEHLAQPSPRVL